MENEEVKLEGTGEIELPKVDISKHIGKKVNIVKVTENKGNFGYYILVETEPVGNIETSKGDVKLRGSRIFGLQEDKEGNVGWGKDTKLGEYLKKMKVDHYKQLEGKEVILQSITGKSGTDFLSFN